ncbi:MAG: HAD-IB family phosphatase [Synechococcales bacterium]|nr:HAD-IB family phosphatase [Synechococcales bacterium]
MRQQSMTTQYIIFSDFDGTITAEETFVALLKQFTPDLSAQLMPEMYAQRLTLREGVRRLLESIPASQYAAILDFAKTKTIRPGLPELLDFLDRQGVPFVVVSGGVRIVVELVLGELKQRVAGIHAVDLETNGEFLKPISEFEDGTELVAKVQVMANYPCEQAIAIGDSITDLNMALAAPIVFARDRLATYLEERGKSYIPWNDFFEVRDVLMQLWSTHKPVD